MLSIGTHLDTLAQSYSELKVDSIEAIDHRDVEILQRIVVTDGIAKNDTVFRMDAIFKRHLLNKVESDYVINIIDSPQTYGNPINVLCYNPCMSFIFYSKDTIVAYYFVSLGCMRASATIKSKNEEWWILGEYGGSMFSELCYKFQFSNCDYSKLPSIEQ